MELSVESSCQNVTWKVRDFFELPSEIGYSLDSPEFRFASDSYCLRLYPNGRVEDEDEDETQIHLLRLTSTYPERSISCKVGYRRKDKEREIDLYLSELNNKLSLNLLYLSRSRLQKNRDIYVPDGTLTVLYSMRLKESSSSAVPQSEEAKTSDIKEEQEELAGESVFLSSRSWSFKMELLIESPCQNVTWNVPDFFQLLSKMSYSLKSPEFRFAGDRYCLRFYSTLNNSGDAVDTDLQLVRLTFNFPERIVLYKVGYSSRDFLEEKYVYQYSEALIGDFGFCLSRSQLERERDKYFKGGTFTVLCSMRLKEQSSASSQSAEAGNSHTEEKQEGLPGVTLLSDCMKELLIKGIDYDVTICVQNKEFRAHRIILSARSPVFAMMLAQDTKENNTSTINIDDCDPESFDEFLLHVYSGRTENLTPSNALQLYYTADKYDFPILKEQCVNMLKASLSVTSICDVVLLAAKHQEKELFEVATEFFAQRNPRNCPMAKFYVSKSSGSK